MPNLQLRFDLRHPAFGADKQSLYQAAIEMAVWADELGFKAVQISSHHGADDGYLPSPAVLAAAIAARTKNIRLRMSLIILPLQNPLRVAEDLAVLDIISGGRVELVVGAGYVPSEFAMFGVDLKDRGCLMEEGIEAIKQAWTGEPFEYQGRPARVTPTPLQHPRPPIWMGGSTHVAARRAARIADYYYSEKPEQYQSFAEECRLLGRDVPPFLDVGSGFLLVADSSQGAEAGIEAEWQRMAPYLLHECNSYAEWQMAAEAGGATYQYAKITDIEPLKSMGLYPILSAEDAVSHIQAKGEQGQVSLHPLVSGFPPEQAWEQLHRFEREVLPRL